jgi:hypothetical protein
MRQVDGAKVARFTLGDLPDAAAWWNAGASHMNDAFRKTFFDRLGLISLPEQHRRLTYAA